MPTAYLPQVTFREINASEEGQRFFLGPIKFIHSDLAFFRSLDDGQRPETIRWIMLEYLKVRIYARTRWLDLALTDQSDKAILQLYSQEQRLIFFISCYSYIKGSILSLGSKQFRKSQRCISGMWRCVKSKRTLEIESGPYYVDLLDINSRTVGYNVGANTKRVFS
ncbi:hypothetical protein BCR41DRAFT_368812 [Lobosporangium transversale]|uniref:Uncharacterized protein n=1 Tax=Lobosporangium transversale TaxID=64571 RepID=A0A1Y2GVA7_9FUNG|nr:hypothetical protein BCR41DRAFT_368812 [Lobosporangium transversale]ORZ25004.1 hypothetical protein BCR41DRAFT_368812 [Lobosporangium transversale]|eukprot:XP_021883985.1 hypothetical protein BCR41DRAFT_368812 [Lobosporangium transversale]